MYSAASDLRPVDKVTKPASRFHVGPNWYICKRPGLVGTEVVIVPLFLAF